MSNFATNPNCFFASHVEANVPIKSFFLLATWVLFFSSGCINSAISFIVFNFPLPTLNTCPFCSIEDCAANTKARATSSTCTKSLKWFPLPSIFKSSFALNCFKSFQSQRRPNLRSVRLDQTHKQTQDYRRNVIALRIQLHDRFSMALL